MYVLITYDIRTVDADGRRRLRQVARKCRAYGQRVQNSVFECKVDPTQCKQLELALICRKTAFGFTTLVKTKVRK